MYILMCIYSLVVECDMSNYAYADSKLGSDVLEKLCGPRITISAETNQAKRA
jgi:hypothetical protein